MHTGCRESRVGAAARSRARGWVELARGLQSVRSMSNVHFVLRALVLALAGSVLVFLGVGQVLADKWTVSTTRVMRLPSTQIAGSVQRLDEWVQWNALDFELGNPTTRTVTGTPGAPGQEAVWSGPKGKAVVVLDGVRSDGVDYRIGYLYRAGDVGGKFSGSITWLPKDEGVEVTWSEQGKLGSLIERWTNWFGALQDKVRQIQSSSLQALEDYALQRGDAEAGGAAPPRDK